jgi:hypothetical protein
MTVTDTDGKKFGESLNAAQLEAMRAADVAKGHQQFATPSKRAGTFPRGEQCGDLVEKLASESVDLAPYSVYGAMHMRPQSDLESEIGLAFTALARIAR